MGVKMRLFALINGVLSIRVHLSRETSEDKFGFTVQTKAKRIHYVADVVRGSPAFEAGLRNGLVITDVNGEHMGGKMNEYVVKKITDYNDVYLRVDNTLLIRAY